MAYEKVSDEKFKQVVSKEYIYDIKDLLVKKAEYTQEIVKIDALIAEAKKLGIKEE